MRGGVRVARDRPHSRAKSFCCSVGCGAAPTFRGGAKTIYESTALRNAEGGWGGDGRAVQVHCARAGIEADGRGSRPRDWVGGQSAAKVAAE